MTDAERDRCRSVQDQLIQIADQLDIKDSARLSLTLPAAMTVGNLKLYLYPKYLAEMMAILRELDR